MLPYGGGKGTKQYGWVTGCSSTYTNWYPGEPNNSDNNEDYVEVYTNGQWNDHTPQQTALCGCEYNPSTVAPSKNPTAAPSRSCTTTVFNMGSCTLTSILCCDTCTMC